jgi:hypothetical protein
MTAHCLQRTGRAAKKVRQRSRRRGRIICGLFYNGGNKRGRGLFRCGLWCEHWLSYTGVEKFERRGE